jgi:hypothetical protein
MLVLDRLLQPLVPLFYQIYTKTVEMLASELPFSLEIDHDCLHYPLGVCMRMLMCNTHGRVALGWIVAASGSVI